MFSDFLVKRFRVGMIALAVVGGVSTAVASAVSGPIALVAAMGSAVGGVIAIVLVLGFTNAFNPLCQDGCGVAASVFFIASGVLISVTSPFAAAGATASDVGMGVGMGIGIALGAWMMGVKPARRRLEAREAHAA